jgi:nucleoside-diphosphate-sugar epimerase
MDRRDRHESDRGDRPGHVSPLAGKRIALVGGAGFIGHRLALSLAERGAQVEVIDSLMVNNLLHHASTPSATRELYVRIIHQRLSLLHDAGIPVDVQDARDYQALSHTLARSKPQIIFHLAAVAHAGTSNKDPYSTFDHSLRTLENALDYSRDNVEQFIYFSSSMVYGNFLAEEVDETHPLDPIGIYGALKLAGERLVIAYEQVFKLPYTIIRPSALYGPGCVSRRVSQIFVEKALAGDKLKIEGDGLERLDFTYIDDLLDGLCLTADRTNALNQTFNMTAGQSRSIQELASIVRDHFPDIELEYVPRDELRPFRGTLDISKARRELGYAPQTTLEEGLARYIDWYRELLAGASVVGGHAPF